MPLDFDRVDITSTENRWVRLARSLHRKRQRYRERAILVEGVRPLYEALRTAAVVVHVVLLSEEAEPQSDAANLASEFASCDTQVRRIATAAFASASDTEHPQGILAITSIPDLSVHVQPEDALLALIADRIRDPGNLGTLMRSAQGAGAHVVYIGEGCVDPYSPKVVRAAMGSHFHVPMRFLRWHDLPALMQESRIYAAERDAESSYEQVDWNEPSAIIVGNETMGLSASARAAATARVGIPLANNLESLNAAVAGSVILFEAARQRRKGWEALENRVHTHDKT